MADHVPALKRHHFLLRRLHSLTGIVPIGVFLIAHLTTNSTILWGMFNTRMGDSSLERRVGTFQEEVTFIAGMPAILLIEITLWVAIAFHSILGMVYIMSSKSNVRLYPHAGNRRYALQRISGYVGILFIFYHVATLRWGWTFLQPSGTVKWDHHYAASTLANIFRGGDEGFAPVAIALTVFYFVAVSMLVFHFANGLWTSGITWGLTVSVGAQRRWGQICFAMGAGLMLMAWGSVLGFALLDPVAAREAEDASRQTEQIHAPALDPDADPDPDPVP